MLKTLHYLQNEVQIHLHEWHGRPCHDLVTACFPLLSHTVFSLIQPCIPPLATSNSLLFARLSCHTLCFLCLECWPSISLSVAPLMNLSTVPLSQGGDGQFLMPARGLGKCLLYSSRNTSLDCIVSSAASPFLDNEQWTTWRWWQCLVLCAASRI